MRYHYTPITMAKVNIVIYQKAGEDVQKLDHSYIAGGNIKCYRHSGAEYGSFLQN